MDGLDSRASILENERTILLRDPVPGTYGDLIAGVDTKRGDKERPRLRWPREAQLMRIAQLNSSRPKPATKSSPAISLFQPIDASRNSQCRMARLAPQHKSAFAYIPTEYQHNTQSAIYEYGRTDIGYHPGISEAHNTDAPPPAPSTIGNRYGSRHDYKPTALRWWFHSLLAACLVVFIGLTEYALHNLAVSYSDPISTFITSRSLDEISANVGAAVNSYSHLQLARAHGDEGLTNTVAQPVARQSAQPMPTTAVAVNVVTPTASVTNGEPNGGVVATTPAASQAKVTSTPDSDLQSTPASPVVVPSTVPEASQTKTGTAPDPNTKPSPVASATGPETRTGMTTNPNVDSTTRPPLAAVSSAVSAVSQTQSKVYTTTAQSTTIISSSNVGLTPSSSAIGSASDSTSSTASSSTVSTSSSATSSSSTNLSDVSMAVVVTVPNKLGGSDTIVTTVPATASSVAVAFSTDGRVTTSAVPVAQLVLKTTIWPDDDGDANGSPPTMTAPSVSVLYQLTTLPSSESTVERTMVGANGLPTVETFKTNVPGQVTLVAASITIEQGQHLTTATLPSSEVTVETTTTGPNGQPTVETFTTDVPGQTSVFAASVVPAKYLTTTTYPPSEVTVERTTTGADGRITVDTLTTSAPGQTVVIEPGDVLSTLSTTSGITIGGIATSVPVNQVIATPAGSAELGPGEVLELKDEDYLAASFLPTILAVLISLPLNLISVNAKLMQPFHALAKSSTVHGATAESSVFLRFYNFSGAFSLFRAFRDAQPVIAISDLVALFSLFLSPIAATTISIHVEDGCMETCFGQVGVSLVPARVLQGLLGIIVLLLVALVLTMSICRWKTGVSQNPWSIAGMASLCCDPELQYSLQQIPRGLSQKVSERRLLDLLAERRYALGHYYDPSGSAFTSTGYGVMLAGRGDSSAQLLRRRSSDLHSEEEPEPLLRKATQPFAVLTWWGRSGLFLVTSGVLVIVVYYEFTDEDSGFRRFMESQSFGVRFMMTALGVALGFLMGTFFSSK